MLPISAHWPNAGEYSVCLERFDSHTQMWPPLIAIPIIYFIQLGIHESTSMMPKQHPLQFMHPREESHSCSLVLKCVLHHHKSHAITLMSKQTVGSQAIHSPSINLTPAGSVPA